jgi:NAD+ kinase
MATVKVTIDDYPFTAYRADSVIVATATGSTGYALSAGGPILYPESHDILLKPVAAHLGLSSGLVLPPTSRIKLTLLSGGPATLSVDGFLDYEPAEGDEVVIEASSYRTRFLRMHPPASYYTTLMRRLVPENGGREPRALL